MVHFSSQLDRHLSTKYMQFIALGNILVYTFTLHTSDNNKEEYCTKQFRYAHLTISANNELKLDLQNTYYVEITYFPMQRLGRDIDCSGTYLHNSSCTNIFTDKSLTESVKF